MPNIVIRAVDYRCKERFSIEEHNGKYSLLFYEWVFLKSLGMKWTLL